MTARVVLQGEEQGNPDQCRQVWYYALRFGKSRFIRLALAVARFGGECLKWLVLSGLRRAYGRQSCPAGRGAGQLIYSEGRIQYIQ
jgi:hypothetical protein